MYKYRHYDNIVEKISMDIYTSIVRYNKLYIFYFKLYMAYNFVLSLNDELKTLNYPVSWKVVLWLITCLCL